MTDRADKAATSRATLSTPLKVGLLLSMAYIVLGVVYCLQEWSALAGLEPNEMGDFLAGGFGPLAFLWLVVGYFQQGTELRQNSRALHLQAAELRASVEQQQRMAEAAEAQLRSLKQAELSSHTPRFVFESGNKSPYGAQPAYFVRITNEGADCHKVVATVRMPCGVTRFVIDEIPFMGQWEIPLQWHDQPPTEGEVKVLLQLVTRGRGRLSCSITLSFVEGDNNALELIAEGLTPFTSP